MPSKKNSNKTGGKNLITNCEQLNSYNAPGFIQDFHSSAVGSVSMMAGAFTGLARALQNQNDRSEHIESQLTHTNDLLKQFETKMIEQSSTITNLAARIETQLTNINTRFEEHSQEFEEKIHDCNQELRSVIDDTAKKVVAQMTKECKKMVSKIASSVKNTESQIKKLNKVCEENRDKIQITKQKVEEARKFIKESNNEMKQQIKELNDYVERTTTDLKEHVEESTDKMTNKVEDLDKRFQEYRFSTDQSLARKADLDDLKRKMDISEFKEFNQKFIELQDAQEEKFSELHTKVEEETEARKNFGDLLQANLASAESDRKQIKEDLEYVKGRVCDVPDPTVMIQRTQQELMDYINQVEAILREEIKARMMQQSASNPSFGSTDGTCFSCGRGNNSTGAFPAFNPRSPKPTTGGGFNPRSPGKKVRANKSYSEGLKMKNPEPMKTSSSLPNLDNPKKTKPVQEEFSPEQVKLPQVPNVNRTHQSGVTVDPFVGVQTSASPTRNIETTGSINGSRPVSRGSQQ